MYQPLLKCFECGSHQPKETFQTIEDLEMHIAKHFSERPLYECPIRTCDIQFYTKIDLWNHCRRNHNQSECDQIEKWLDKKLKTFEILNKSIISRFTSDTDGINHFECSKCKENYGKFFEKFGSAESLEAHIVRCHCGGSPLYECDDKTCGGILYTYGMFLLHCVSEHNKIKDVTVRTKFQIYNSFNNSIAMSLAGGVNEEREELWTVPKKIITENTIFDEDEDDMESVEMNIPCEDSLDVDLNFIISGDDSFENARIAGSKILRVSNENIDDDQLADSSDDVNSRKLTTKNSVAGFDKASQSNQETSRYDSNRGRKTNRKSQLTNHNTSKASQRMDQESAICRSSNQDQKSQSTNQKTRLNRDTNPSERKASKQKPQKRYECNECPYFCNRSDTLAVHIRTHTSKISYKCSECSYASFHRRSLTNHIRTHTGEKPFKCNKCSYACAEKGYLKKHMMSRACGNPVKIRNHSKFIATESNTRDHTLTLKKPFKCKQCYYSTLNAGSFNAHLRTHTSGEFHNCDQRGSKILNRQ
ncbi:zinc-finger double domain-containing protein [Ditylenchus destructor]|uniref:Zinc-finger double domain-containing protein n=1 Tax=Ditylenchus destructor TaxID=166010 RepID=A0AAD4MGB8_9BILA|nr:zinc-finger double domain-containing protein [Ditylenchus destructor]